ncbi:MAG: AAA family ATPase [Anaerolineaceae bacterium]|nr:AAA family ATPase [Anaerolineaceae bacterium]
MLTRLKLTNWRSVQSATIDFTPITVFIGANASGKTNILDAIRFRRDSLLQRGLVSVVKEWGYWRIQTDALKNNEPVELEYTYRVGISPKPIREILTLSFDKRDTPFQVRNRLYEGEKCLRDESEELPIRDVVGPVRWFTGDEQTALHSSRALLEHIYPLILKRWQILGDNFAPPLRLSDREGGSVFVLEPDARNMLRILEFMRQFYPDLYKALQTDLNWILDFIESVDVWQQDEETRLLVREKTRTAPTISMGTSRLLAMLTAFYALEMPQSKSDMRLNDISTPDMPGLVVIEEPDAALNPLLLKRLVEQIRNYVEGDHPRQVIMTTHNPLFLNYFKPEEVRVVERDENGFTTVRNIPDHILDIWLDEYGLGDVWLTRSLGGVPE